MGRHHRCQLQPPTGIAGAGIAEPGEGGPPGPASPMPATNPASIAVAGIADPGEVGPPKAGITDAGYSPDAGYSLPPSPKRVAAMCSPAGDGPPADHRRVGLKQRRVEVGKICQLPPRVLLAAELCAGLKGAQRLPARQPKRSD